MLSAVSCSQGRRCLGSGIRKVPYAVAHPACRTQGHGPNRIDHSIGTRSARNPDPIRCNRGHYIAKPNWFRVHWHSIVVTRYKQRYLT